MRDDNFDTAEMLRRLKRQATTGGIGETDDPVSNVVTIADDAVGDDSTSAEAGDPTAGFTWSVDEWGYSTW